MRQFGETFLVVAAMTPLLVVCMAWALFCARPGLMRKMVEPILLLVSAIVVLVIVFTGIVMRLPVLAMFLAMSFGWWNVAYRAAPHIEVNVAGVATGTLCLALTTLVLHLLAAWIYREVHARQERIDWPPAWRWSWTCGIVAVVLLMFVAGLVGVGLFRTTGWLFDTTEFVVRQPDFLR